VEIARSGKRTEENYANFFVWLEHFRQTVKEKFLVVLIPDEFQVNDALYGELTALPGIAGQPADRFLPQKRILEFCRKQKIDCLDLLPVLQEAEKSGHTYHVRDTHWNARGNRIAAEAIESRLITVLSGRE
jgi:hypothetical protein